MKLEEEIKKLVVHTVGTEKPQVMQRTYPNWNDHDDSFDMYFNPYKHTWSTSLVEAYVGHIHNRLENMIIKTVKKHLKELGHED